MTAKYLYEVRLPGGSSNKKLFPLWFEHMTDNGAFPSDRYGMGQGLGLIITHRTAAQVHHEMTRSFDTDAEKAMVIVTEVTSDTLAEDHGTYIKNVESACKPLSDFPNLKAFR